MSTIPLVRCMSCQHTFAVGEPVHVLTGSLSAVIDSRMKRHGLKLFQCDACFQTARALASISADARQRLDEIHDVVPFFPGEILVKEWDI